MEGEGWRGDALLFRERLCKHIEGMCDRAEVDCGIVEAFDELFTEILSACRLYVPTRV